MFAAGSVAGTRAQSEPVARSRRFARRAHSQQNAPFLSRVELIRGRGAYSAPCDPVTIRWAVVLWMLRGLKTTKFILLSISTGCFAPDTSQSTSCVNIAQHFVSLGISRGQGEVLA